MRSSPPCQRWFTDGASWNAADVLAHDDDGLLQADGEAKLCKCSVIEGFF